MPLQPFISALMSSSLKFTEIPDLCDKNNIFSLKCTKMVNLQKVTTGNFMFSWSSTYTYLSSRVYLRSVKAKSWKNESQVLQKSGVKQQHLIVWAMAEEKKTHQCLLPWQMCERFCWLQRIIRSIKSFEMYSIWCWQVYCIVKIIHTNSKIVL